MLPLGDKSLVYGSDNAGIDVHTSNTEVNNLMSEAGKKLNFQSRKVNNIDFYGPIDIEGHLVSWLDYFKKTFSCIHFIVIPLLYKFRFNVF